LRWLCLAGLFLFTGCGGGSDPVRATIDEIVRAAEKRDASSVMDRLSADFQAADGSGRADAEAMLRRYLAAYESLNVRISDLTIERAAGAARARFRAELSGKPRQIAGLDGWLPRTSSYKFDLRLSPDSGGRWLITSAGWEEAPGR
jgi:hypothetical protein